MKLDVLSILLGLVIGVAVVFIINSAIGKNAKKEAQKVLDERG